jgi:acyl-CoA reductase-like NAD-dependent aldehyde dehydrogenase
VDAAIAHLQSRKDVWTHVSIADRIHYLKQCMDGVRVVSDRWTKTACNAKGIDPNSPLAGEEWIASVVTTLLNLRSLVKTLEADGQRQPTNIATRSTGQQVATVFPDNLKDRLLWLGFRGEVWIEPGKPISQGKIYRQDVPGGVALVLGAGNIASTPPMDSLYKLFAENQVVLLKMNPVNAYVGMFLEEAFEPLMNAGFLQIVYGGADLGQYLCQHPGIDSIHITGSHHTHDAIVWGETSDQHRRKQNNDPVLKKPITSELGCVTPILVVPGKWSASDLTFQARHVASMVVHNASFNCVAAKVVVTAKGWDQRDEYLSRLRQELASIPSRHAYYPGAQRRYQAFLDRYPQSQVLGERTDEIVPWTVIPDVPADENECALRTEAFCGVLADVSLDATTASDFLEKAVEFANQEIWGNLSCMILVDSKTQKQNAQELESAIATLQYGAIAINAWSGVVYALPDLAWGAYPGNSLADIKSGIGVDHNAYLFDYPQKSVLYAPFRIRPIPFWFAKHRNLLNFAKRAADLQMTPTWTKLLQVVFAALKG